MVGNWLIVMPKIRRVWSGEQVVVSHMLRRVNNQTSEALSSDNGSTKQSDDAPFSNGAATTHNAQSEAVITDTTPVLETTVQRYKKEKIVLKEDDPIPGSVEAQMYGMSRIIQKLSEKW
jgi:hypothetical protein